MSINELLANYLSDNLTRRNRFEWNCDEDLNLAHVRSLCPSIKEKLTEEQMKFQRDNNSQSFFWNLYCWQHFT